MTVRLDLTTAVVLAIVFAIGYVAPFYLLFPSRLLALSREHPEVIRRRILCVSVSTTLSVGMTSGLLAYLGIGDVVRGRGGKRYPFSMHHLLYPNHSNPSHTPFLRIRTLGPLSLTWAYH